LANAGYQVSLVVADGKGDELIDGVSIHDVGTSSGRLDRIRKVTKRVLARAIEIDASIYHFHDPELIPAGLKLKRLGKRVIFDSHEDVPKQLLGKPYLNTLARVLLSEIFKTYEYWTCKKFDAIVTATPFIRDKFIRINSRTVDINNFPLLGELSSDAGWVEKRPEVCYVGGIAQIRGVCELVRAMGEVKSSARLQLAGTFSEPSIGNDVKAYPGWCRVDELGHVDRTGVREILRRCVAGIVTFLPAPNHIDSQPNKMFEYMSAGVPVIASNFPLWREIIQGNDCGVCVDPGDSKAIAEAIDFLAMNPDAARAMGERGKNAVCEKYNWSVEERKLLALYSEILGTEGAEYLC
jgi:glycosyltransferase involved in cell wall biosynthesis